MSGLRAPVLVALATTQAGCIVVGYRSGAGWFMWPGGIGLIVMLALLALMFLRRGRF